MSAPVLHLTADTIVDPAGWNFPDGKWGTTVNGQTFQQEGLVSFNGYQYAAYFADGGVLAIGRRKLRGIAWEVIHFSDYKAKDHRDSHNVATIGISEGDGAIHLAFDHHCDVLRYRRSIQTIASHPEKFEWKAEHFGAITSELDGGRAIESVTYPQFFSAPGGKLQLIYRTGWSGAGDWHLAEYDPASQGHWTILGRLLALEGEYQISPTRCGYPNPLRYDAQGRLHMTWCWRESPKGGPNDLRSNHDLLYAFSDDLGRTWKNNAGQSIASLPDNKPIHIGTAGIIIHPTKWLWGQMNTVTQTIDAKGRVHFLSWHLPPESAEASNDLNLWRLYHYWRDPSGKWTENKLPFHGRKPQLVLDSAGNAFVVLTQGESSDYHHTDPGGNLTIMTATESSNWTDWKPAFVSNRVSVGEPILDNARWANEGMLSVYLQDKPATPGQPSALRVLDFAPAK